MNWTVEQIADAIQGKSAPEAQTGFATLGLWDPTEQIGVGRNERGHQILVLPPQSDVAAFQKRYADFLPLALGNVVTNETFDGHFAVLDCKFDLENETAIKTLSGVFSGLIDVHLSFGAAGLAVWSMKRLFEMGLDAPSPENLTGLIGELTVIAGSPDKELMVEAWHNDADDVYDFSINARRIEVKTTKSTHRHHHFSSNQLPGPQVGVVLVASVKLAVTEIGQSLLDLFELVTDGLSLSLCEKVSRIIIETIGVPAHAVIEPTFDLSSTLNSIRFYSAEDVPTPETNPGVLSLEWKADLEHLTPVNLLLH
jgi:hypothetical protein